MIILLQIFLNCYYYYTFRHNISVRKIKPNPAFTLLNLYTIQFTVRSKPTQRPKPSPLTLNTVDNSRNKTRQNTLFFPPEQPPLDEAKYPLNQGILLPGAKGKPQYPRPPRRRRCTKTRKRGGWIGSQWMHAHLPDLKSARSKSRYGRGTATRGGEGIKRQSDSAGFPRCSPPLDF